MGLQIPAFWKWRLLKKGKKMKHGFAGILMLVSTLASAATEIELLLPATGGRFAESAPGQYPVKVNLDALKLASGDEVKLTLSGSSHVVVYERSARHENGDVTWVGYLKEKGNDYRVIITRGATGSFGHIHTPNGEFVMQPGDGIELLVDRKRAGYKILPMGDDVYIPKDMPFFPALPEAALQNSFADADAVVDIDLMILYTPGMAKRYPSPQTRLNHLVSLTNQIFIDSKVGINLRLVHSAQVEYSETTNNGDALQALKKGSAPALSGVAALRAQYGADLVMLIRPLNSEAVGGVCGIATMVGAEGSDISQYGSWAFSVVSDGEDIGERLVCWEYTFAHELGHNLGCQHDRANSGQVITATEITRTGDLQAGAFPYSYGYVKPSSFGTIMSYFTPRVGKFSNPAITCNGEPCGISENAPDAANNALSLNNTRFAIAKFMPTGGIKPEFTDNGDGTATHQKTGLTWMRCVMGQTWTGKTCSGTPKEYPVWNDAAALTASFADKNDWRLPTITELQSIVDRKNYKPTIDNSIFPGTPTENFWSSTAYAPSSSMAWDVRFYDGVTNVYSKSAVNTEIFYVRLVRGGQAPDASGIYTPGTDFADNGDGSITHKKTGLTWKRCLEGQTWAGSDCSGAASDFTWDQAGKLSSTFSGQKDWRLPDGNELTTIAEYGGYGPAVNTKMFPGISKTSGLWSASGIWGTYAWWLYANTGDVSFEEKTETHQAILVRGTQAPAPTPAPSSTLPVISDTERLFNWAEFKYPELFKPAKAVTKTQDGYSSRYYSDTKADLVFKDNRVYYTGPLTNEQKTDVGAFSDFLSLAKAAGF